MSIAAQAQAAFRAIRTAQPEAFVTVRTGGKQYRGFLPSMRYSMQADSMGPIGTAGVELQLLVAELTPPYPKTADDIEVGEAAGMTKPVARTITSATMGTAGVILHLTIAAKSSAL
jgi:hypothetical protein